MQEAAPTERENEMGRLILGLIIVGTSLSLTGFPASAAQSSSIDKLTVELVRLRNEVEALNEEIESSKETQRSELKALSIQKSELEADIQRQRLGNRQVKDKISIIKKQLAGAGLEKDGRKEELLKSIQNIENYISSTMPFKQKKRLSELEKIKSGISSETMTLELGFNRLWNFVEDEFRLSKENGIFRQKILVDGSEYLAQVVRLGMIAMFYKIDGQALGSAVNENGTWAFKPFENRAHKKQVEQLFASFKKQVRTGEFRIPNFPAVLFF